MLILIDSGHGAETPGKRSPDGRLREYRYCREIADEVTKRLEAKGYECIHIMAGVEADTPLRTRTNKINEYCSKYGSKNVLSVSIHCNAMGNGADWNPATGWEVYVAPNASKNSEDLATKLAEAAKEQGLKLRTQRTGYKFWISNLAMCRDPKCPSVLTENLFQDNKQDVDFLLSKEGKEKIINLHVNGIINYIQNGL